MATINPKNYQLWNTLTRHNDKEHGEWKGLRGRISLKMIQECGFPGPASDTFIFICGPSSFKSDLIAFLQNAGYNSSMYG